MNALPSFAEPRAPAAAPAARRGLKGAVNPDQRDVVAFLARAAAYPHPTPPPVHVQTHISHVFLAGSYVYKLKKAVRLPFVDQSTAAKRAALCAAEVRLNRRLAAPIYLGRVAVTRAADGRLRLGGKGRPVEHLVLMRRLPAARSLVHMVAHGTATTRHVAGVARTLAAFHATAPAGPAVACEGRCARLRTNWADVLALTARVPSSVLRASEHGLLAAAGPAILAAQARRFDRRRAAGRIREGHGDLHAEQVYVLAHALPALPTHPAVPAGPWLVDRLEFSRALRSCDVASEVAFLAMDLERRGRRDLADAFVDAYVAAADDEDLRTVLPFYVAYRGCIRGAVEALKAGESEVAAPDAADAIGLARRAFATALHAVWRAGRPVIVVCCGPSGTGKSTVAEGLAASTGLAHVSSDRIRKETAGIAPGTPAPAASYMPAARTAVYDELCARAAAHLRAGAGVVLDATFLRRRERARIAATAARHDAPLCFVACDTPADVIRTRLAARPRTWSDATWEVSVRQQATREPFHRGETVIALDTGHAPDVVGDAALTAVWRWFAAHALSAERRQVRREAR